MDKKLSEESGYSIVYPIWKKIMKNTSEIEAVNFKHKFIKGYTNRPSVRISNPVGTKPDPMIDVIISARLPGIDLKTMCIGHRLSMSAENILGPMLEEYIHDKVHIHNWSCCWGNAIKAVDLCSSDGKLYQIKNRSNSENSSSSAIRVGTDIKKWFRIDAKTGRTNWDDLSLIIGIPHLFSEEEFGEFCKNLVKMNPAALYVENSLLT
jgi:hypothetical protein